MPFTKGNSYASKGGQARARALSPEQRQEIARRARQGNVIKNFAGDDEAQRQYFAALGMYNYEQMVGQLSGGYGRGVQQATRHPGRPAEWMEWYRTGKQAQLIPSEDVDIQF